MRKRVYLMGIIVFNLGMNACQKDDIIYSCNEDINVWVLKNVSDIRMMSSQDWQSVNDADYQRAIYRAFTVDQRISLWQDKLEKALALDWTEKEKKHIEWLSSFINLNIKLFEYKGEMSDAIELDLYKWVDYATEELGWDDKTVYSICMTPEILKNNKELPSDNISEVASLKTRSEVGVGEKTCNCWGWPNGLLAPCPYDKFRCAKDVDCDEVWGCGPLWTQVCIGLCVSN